MIFLSRDYKFKSQNKDFEPRHHDFACHNYDTESRNYDFLLGYHCFSFMAEKAYHNFLGFFPQPKVILQF